VLVGDLNYDLRFDAIFSASGFYNLKRDLTSWTLIPLVIALALAILAFNRWRHHIPATFQMLLSKSRIASVSQAGDLHQEYQRFLEEYQRALLSHKRYFLVSTTVIICFLIFLVTTIQQLSYTAIPPVLWTLRLVAGLCSILVAVIWGYFFGIGAWAMCITGLYIKNLTSKFNLTIQPRHPDKCGGLKSLGDFCLSMALPILIGATFLGIWGIGATLYPDLIADPYIRPQLIVAGNAILFLFALPLAFIAFFLPLWNVHLAMVARKERYADECADRVAKLEQKIWSSLDKGELEEAKAVREEVEFIQTLRPDKINYPVWPFDLNILLRFLTPQIVPIVSLVVGLSAPAAEALKSALSIFTGR